MNLKREIKNLKGEGIPMSFIGASDIEKVKKEKGVTQVLLEDMPRETVENVLINSISNYDVKNKKEVFELNALAQWVLDERQDKPALSERFKDFLSRDILPMATSRQEEITLQGGESKTEQRGIYAAWIMVQVYQELGITE